MTRIGYFLSSEEYDPASLIKQAVLAQRAGFEALWISEGAFDFFASEILPRARQEG